MGLNVFVSSLWDTYGKGRNISVTHLRYSANHNALYSRPIRAHFNIFHILTRLIQVSKASADLMRYCGENAKYDPLLMGIPASENPFKDKKPCTIL
uniref:Guanine nucleotide-binding protein subunit gamma n=1 Tax=Sinocyclocheilus grahami TaxID=75366 RepID=A0A672TAF8_SINGR